MASYQLEKDSAGANGTPTTLPEYSASGDTLQPPAASFTVTLCDKLRRFSAFFLLIVINVIQAGYDVALNWGLSPESSGGADRKVLHPFVFAFIRSLGATVILFSVAIYKESRYPPEKKRIMLRPEDTGVAIAAGESKLV